jgi:hypothetical protein
MNVIVLSGTSAKFADSLFAEIDEIFIFFAKAPLPLLGFNRLVLYPSKTLCHVSVKFYYYQ